MTEKGYMKLTQDKVKELQNRIDELGILHIHITPDMSLLEIEGIINQTEKTMKELTPEVLEKARNAPMDEGYTL